MHGRFFFISFIIFVPPFLYPSGDTDPGSHSRLFPLPTTVHDLHFNREIFIPLLPLTRVELSLPTLDALSCWVFFAFQVNSKSHHGEIRTQGLILVAFEDYYQSTGATGLHADHTCTCEEPGTCKIMGGGLNRPSVCISHDRMITYKIFQSVSQPRELSVLP